MGKNLLRKIFAFIVMVVGAVTIFSACSKDPYKKMRLALDKTEVTIVYDDDDNDKNVFSISATVSGVGKKVSKDVTFVVGDNSVVSPIGSDYVSTSGDKTTATFIATSNGGKTYIDVLTLEGNKRQRVDVNVVVPIENMAFEMDTLPIERGVKTDITSKFDGVSTQIYDRLTFTPQNTTQRDVILIATDDSGNAFTGNEVTIDGNYITVNSEILNSFKLTATSKDNSEITASITCTVLDTIDTDNISLMQVMGDDDPIALEYTFEQGQKVYLLDLASTSSNSENDKRKEVYIDFDTVGQFDKYTVGLVTSDTLPYSIVDDKQGHFAVYGGVYDSTGLSYFALRYKGYENLFEPKYITLRVNVSTFPDKISFTDGVETIDSVKVYQNYHSSVGGATVKLNIFNGNTTLNAQTAYLSVEADGYGAISGVKLWYYSAGTKCEIGAGTAVRHGETIYINYNANALANITNTIKLVAKSAVCDVTGSVKLDLVKGSVMPVFANGSVIKLEETDDVDNPNTFLLSTVELEDLPYLTLGSDKISLSDCVVRLQNNSVVTCVYDETQKGFVFTAGKLPSGTTDMSVSGSITTPNGMVAYFEVLVYANVNSDTLALRIGNKNYVFSDSDISLESYPLTMQTGSNIEMKLVKLLDFKMDAFGDLTDEYDPEGRYEIFSVLPSNINFEDISYDGDAVVSVDSSNKFLIRSASNSTGTRKVSYTLSSTSFDPSVSNVKSYVYIAFNITVKSRLSGFSLSDISGEKANSFSIITTNSISHSSAESMKTASLKATASPSNYVLSYQDLSFEVRYEDKNVSSNGEPIGEGTEIGYKYSFTINQGDSKEIKNFVILAKIENNTISMTFSCDNLIDMDSASIKITLVYASHFDDNSISYSDRSTVFDGNIKNAVKATNVSFDRNEVMFNVNQFGIDSNGKVTISDRATATVNYVVAPSANLTIEGFYLFYKNSNGGITQLQKNESGYYIINDILQVFVGSGCINVTVLKFEDGVTNIEIYLAPIDMADKNDQISLTDEDLIPATLEVTFRNGTEDNPYAIQDEYDLQFVNNQLNAYYKLANDILISSSTDWTPIGQNAEKQFTGHIDGNNCTISGLVLNRKVDLNEASDLRYVKDVVDSAGNKSQSKGYAAYYGLFGYIGMNAEIKDITLTNFHVYVEYDGEQLGVKINEHDVIVEKGEDVYVDVYVGGFAGLNLGTLTNVTVIDDTERGYSSLKGNILNSLRMSDDSYEITTKKGIGYQSKTLYLTHSNNVFAGGMVGLNAGKIDEGKAHASLFIRDKQEHPTLKGISTAYVGGVSGVNISTSLTSGDTIYSSGSISNVDVYSLINATLVDPVFKGMIRNEDSVLGGIVGLNISGNDKYAFVKNSTCKTIIIGQNNVGGAIGQNYGVLDNVTIIPHIYGCDYVGGAVGINANNSKDTLTKQNTDVLKTYFYFSNNKGLVGANSMTYKGLVYHTKVQFVDTLDEISLFNTSIVGRNYVGGLVGYSVDSYAENADLQKTDNLKSASQYGFDFDDTYATVAYSSVKSYFTREYTNVLNLTDEVKVLSQLYMDFSHKDENDDTDFNKKIVVNAESKYYGDIVVLSPTKSDVKNTYIGGLIGYSDGGVSTSGQNITAGTGGNYIHVYFDAIISNTYSVNSETDTAVIGGLIGKANGILFVYNANVLGSVKNAKCVGGFVGDASEVFDRLGHEGKTPYTQDDSFFQTSIGAKQSYSGKFNINNSYTTLKSGSVYVQNFAYLGERVVYKTASGSSETSQVNTIKYSTNTNSGYGGQGNDKNYYYAIHRVNNVTIKEYSDNEVKDKSSKRKVEYRRVLKYIDTLTVAVQDGYEVVNTTPVFEEDKEGVDGYFNVLKYDTNTIYWTKANDWTNVSVPEYNSLYYASNEAIYKPQSQLTNYVTFDKLSNDVQTAAKKLLASGDNTSDYLYDNNGVAKYKKAENYYIKVSQEEKDYYQSQTDETSIKVIVYTVEQAYVEVKPKYKTINIAKYNNGSDDLYWYNSYTYTKSDDNATINNTLYDIYNKSENKTKTNLAKDSIITEYVVGDNIYSNIEIANSMITFYKDGSVVKTVAYESKNMYHSMLGYVVNNQELNDITNELGQGMVEFSYNRLTASNSFYVGFKTYLYDQNGGVLKENDTNKEVEFTKTDAKNTTLTTNETSYSYYPTDWHYTNINYSDLIFKNYSNLNGNLSGYYVKYEDDVTDLEISEYKEGQVLIKGEGFVNPYNYIADYQLNNYAYALYEGGENGLVKDESTVGKYTYHYKDVNGGLPLAFGKYQSTSETELNLIIDIAPENLKIEDKIDQYKVDNVIKNQDGSLSVDNNSRPIAVILDYKEGDNSSYSLIGGNNNVVDISLLPKFVGYDNLKVVSSNSAVVEVQEEQDTNDKLVYNLITKGVGYAVINISSLLNNTLSCDIVVLVKESVASLTYTYSTPNGIEALEAGQEISILKNNSSTFSVSAKCTNDDVVLKNFGVEYTIEEGSAIINGETYSKGMTAYVYGVSQAFKVDEGYKISARPFYLYEVSVNDETYLYRKYVDALTGNSEITTESVTYSVSPNSFAYNISAPGNIKAGIASQTSFEILVQSNDKTLVPFEVCFGEKDDKGNDKFYSINTTLENGAYKSLFDDSKDTIKVNNLNITLVKTTYDNIKGRHTIRFVVDVDVNDYNNFTKETKFEFACKIDGSNIADNQDKSDKFTFTLIPFQVENVRMSHYTKFWYDESLVESDKYETEYKSYKYASNKIIPGYNSLLQVDITPSYGQFDYVIAEIVGTDGSIIRQLVESQKSQSNAQGVMAYYDFPYFEQVDNASNIIKVTNKYSSFNDKQIEYNPSLALSADGQKYFNWDESGTLLFALNLDSKYENSTVTVRVRGYAQGDSLQFEQSITLNVVELPRVSVSWDKSDKEYITGDDKSATLNIGGSLALNVDTNADKIEWESEIGRVINENGKYKFYLDTNLDEISKYINSDYDIKCSVVKTIDGQQYSAYTSIKIRPVLYMISGVSFVDNEECVQSMKVYYNEEKDIKVQIDAIYNENNSLEKLKSDTIASIKASLNITNDTLLDYIETQLKEFAKDVWSQVTQQGANTVSKYLYLKTSTTTSEGLKEVNNSRRGYIITRSDDCFTIRIASSSVKDNIMASVAFDYTDNGLQIYPQEEIDRLSLYSGRVVKELTFNVHASSREDNPLPIKSVDDFKNMVAGEHYILLNDLVLSKWMPIKALFASLDGNGYTITITSFGDIEGLTDIGLFSTIGTEDSDLNYYTTIQNLYIDICPVVESENDILYIDKEATLEINIGATENVRVGVLAGTNYGIVTNVNVTNNASHIRTSRKESLKSVGDAYKELIVEDFSKYFADKKTYTDSLNGNTAINIDSDTMIDTFSIVTNNTKETQGLYVGGLVGLNTAIGYITNSSVENVNVKGMDYVAGFVAQNMGYISSSYFKGGSVISNDKQTKANSATAGFVAKNENGKIQFSYVLGAETADVYNENNTISYTTKETHNINSMSTYIYSDSNSDMLVLNSNSPEYSASDKRTGKIQISLTDYAGYTMYKDYKNNGTNQDIANLRALGSAVYTNNYASGFVGENNAYISNCYANILVSGTYGAGFAYQNSGEIESSYSMSSIKNNNENYYPFTQSKTDVDKCYYLYVNASDGVTDETIKDSFSKSNDDVSTSLYAAAFGDYNTFTSWGFNSDYTQNNKLDDGVWFIPAKSETIKSTSDGMKKYLRESSYTSLRPELVSANIFTMSLRYYVTNGDKYEYNSVDNWKFKNDGRSLIISQGSLNNPLLIATASDFNTNLSPAKDQNNNDTLNSSIVRMVHDIAFNEIQTATTFSTDYIGNFEGNGLSIDKLRVVADASSVGNQVTYLGLFRSIQSKTETKNTDGKYTEVVSSGTVRNLNINIEEMAGSNINFVGVLAGVIDGGKVYNINIYSTYDNVRVEGLNAVGGLAGMIVGDADIVNITNNISVKANAINQLNIFDPKKPNSINTQFKMYVSNGAMKNPFENWEYDGDKTEVVIADTINNISYVGGIAGIIDVNKNPNNSKLDYTDRIRQCYVNQSITLSGDVVGGLAGYVGKESSLSNSEFVICENTTLNALRVGGAIVGHNEGSLNRVLVKYNNQKQVDANFYNAENNTQNNSAYYNALDNARSDSAYTLDIRSDVFGENAHYIGGIIGANFGGTLKNSYSRLNVVNINSAYAGGLIGLNIGGELDTVYTTGSVTGYFATGGIIGIQPAILSIIKEENGTPKTYYYLDDQSSAIKQDAYTYRYIENISDVLYSLCESKDEPTKIQTTYSNVVGANIWRYSDTSVYRSQYYSTQGSAWIGVFVGYMSDVSDENIFNKEYEYLSPIKSANEQSRLITEDTFFKQTYEFNTASNSYIKEIGNIKNKKVNTDITNLKEVVSDTNKTIISAYYTLDGIKYPVSRMQYYGSLRSLNEIVSRSYSVNDEISVWRRMSIQCEASDFDSDVKHVSIYYGFDPFNWNGTQIDSEYNTIVNEVSGVRDVFPEIVNNLKPKIINVTSETELRTMSLYLDSTFILQNDIELGFGWTPVGTEDKPFTGKLYSATGHTYTISKLSIDDNNNDYFGFIRVSEGAELRDFNIECNSIKNNTDAKSTSIAGGILVGLASEESGGAITTIKNVKVSINPSTNYVVQIHNTQYVGGVVGYGKGLSISNVTLEKYEEPTVATLSSTTDNAKFFTSMYKAGDNISYAFGGLVGKFDKVDTQTSTTTNTLSVETTSRATVSTLSVNNIDFYVNDSNKITESTLIASNNRNFDENKVYVGGVLGQTNTAPDWKIATSGVSITADMPDSTIYDLYIGGAVGYSSYVDYTSDIEVDTNIKATLKNNSANNPSSIGGVFGGISDGEVNSIENKNNNTITLNITNTNNKVYVGGVVGYASSTTFSSAKSNTKSNITTIGDSEINAGGFVGRAVNSKIQNAEIGGGEITNNVLTSKIDIITLEDDIGGIKSIFLGGIAGYVSNTTINTSNILGNIKHPKGSSAVTSENMYGVYIGGAVGYSTSGGTLDQVSADVDIYDLSTKQDGTFNYGGLVGDADTYNITNSYAVGKIYSVQHIKYLGYITSDKSNGTYLGGLVGNGNGVTFENCYSVTQFVLPNSDDGLLNCSQSFWENTNKGGIIGCASGTCASDNVYYVKDFVPFSNGLCGTGVSAEALKNEFNAGLSDENQKWKTDTDNFYPLLNSANGKVTNTKGGGQNPIVVTTGTEYITKTDDNITTNNITSAQTVYAQKSTGSDYNIVLDDRMSTLVVVGENTLIKVKESSTGGSGATTQTYGKITNNGTIFGGSIYLEEITNNGNIIGVSSYEVIKDNNINTSSVYKVDNSNGFIYASGVFKITNEANSTSRVVNCAYTGNDYTGNNLNVVSYKYNGSTKSATKSGLYSQNVEFFDRSDTSDTSLDLDIDKYWTRVSGGIFVPKWMYKDHYYDDDYNSTYGWYASASKITQNGTTYIVSSAEGLAYIAKQVNTGELIANAVIELSADIDLSGKVWTPIGTKDHPFNGTFNGKGHTISNMSVVGNTYNGLFGVVENATIQNVLIKDAQVASSGTSDCTAILVGYAKGTLTIEKVAIEDSHICAGNSSVAGMVGYIDNCKLTVNNAYVIIGVNTKRTEFSFVVNTGSGTITINYVYGVNYAYSADDKKYDITEKSSYYRIAGCFTNSDTKTNTYVCSTGSIKDADIDIVGLKTLSDLKASESYKTLFEGSTVWTQITGINHELPHLDFSQKYWIDEGVKTSVTPSDNTYTIDSAEKLAWVAYKVNSGTNNFSGKTIQVTKTIDLAGKVWTPIGITGHSFKGSFVLKEGCTISNMTCYGAYSTTRDNMTDTTTSYGDGYDSTYGGLFGLVENSPSMKVEGNITNFIVGSVKNGAPFIAEYKVSNMTSAPTISVASIGSSSDDSLKDTVSASNYAGGVVGKITGTNSVKANIVGNVVKANISAQYAGGIVGYANYATIYNSSVSEASIIGTTRTGGIVGEATNSTLFNCQASGFSLTSTGSGDCGGIVGRAVSTKLSALKVEKMTADIKADYAGGIVGYVSHSNIQNITYVGQFNTIASSTTYGGVVGYMDSTNLSEISIIGTIPNVTKGKIAVGDIKNYDSNYKTSKYIVDNIYVNIKEKFIDTNKDYTYKLLFGGLSLKKDIFSESMVCLTDQGISNTVYYGDISSSSAWKYDEENKQYTLKANGSTLCSNYRMQNADNLTAILSGVETVDGHVVITPYKLESVNVSTNEGMQYLAEWWTYRHKESNNITINITSNIENYSANSIGNEKFAFVGTLNGNSKTITLSKDVSSQGIIGYATKLNASDINIQGAYTIGSSTTDYVGALVGRIVGDSDMTFKNIKSSVGVSGKNYVGGIIGAVEWSNSNGSITLTGCETQYATKLTVTGDNNVGGIIGYVNDTSSSKQRVKITGSNTEYVPLYIKTTSIYSATGKYVGGIVGYGQNVVIENYKLKNSSDTSSYGTVVSGKGDYVGGVAGYLKNSTVNNITLNSIPVSAYGSNVGGAVGYAINSTISNITVNTTENSNATISGEHYVGGIAGYIQQTKMYSNKVEYFNVKGDGRVGGLIGELRDASTDTIIELKDSVYSNTVQNASIKQNASITNEFSNDNIGGLIGRLVAGENSTFTMSKAENNSNKVSDTKIIYYKKVDSDEGWFGTYDNGKISVNNRWANTSGIVTIDNIKNMALGKYAQQIINNDYSYWYPPTYKGYSTKEFTFDNVESTNTWFGPSATQAVRFENTDDLNNYYLSTFGVSPQITGYGNTTSLSLPDLRSDTNIKNFFNSARGYNPSNSIAMVGTLYGSNNITDTVSKAENVTIESTLNGGEEKRVLYDRLTHWAYINMENGYHGALVIEWSYYIDSDQRMPQSYDFISDVQKYFTTKENKRIDVKYTYDITESDKNFDLHLNNLTPVSESLRSLRDLFSRSTTAGGNSTYKGLINEFVMAVYDKETRKKSLYCGNEWKSVDENGNKNGYTLDISTCKFDGGTTFEGKFKRKGSTISTTYYRNSSTNDPSVWYGSASFDGDRKIIKQKSSMNNA